MDIVVPTRGRGALIETTISSIRQSIHTNFTLWIIDQSDDDATAQTVAPHQRADARVRYVHSIGRGISVARNEGVALGCAPFILFTDDDCAVAPCWVGTMLDELAQEETWAVFGRVLPSVEGSGTAASAELPPVPIAIKTSLRRAVYKGSRFNLGFGHGACMGVRRSSYEQVYGFDELLGTGGPLHSWEDRDLGYRVLRRGGRIVYAPGSLVYHRQWRDWGEVQRTYRSYALGAGAATAKYLRCGDWGGCYLFGEWLLDQGLRQIVSGALKWRSWQKVLIGIFQFIYPWVGLAQGLRYPVDRQRMLYRPARRATIRAL